MVSLVVWIARPKTTKNIGFFCFLGFPKPPLGMSPAPLAARNQKNKKKQRKHMVSLVFWIARPKKPKKALVSLVLLVFHTTLGLSHAMRFLCLAKLSLGLPCDSMIDSVGQLRALIADRLPRSGRSGVCHRHPSQPPKHPYYTGRNSREIFVSRFLVHFPLCHNFKAG